MQTCLPIYWRLRGSRRSRFQTRESPRNSTLRSLLAALRTNCLAFDLVTMMEGQATKSTKVVCISLPILPILHQGVETVLLHQVVRQLDLTQRVKEGSHQKMNVGHKRLGKDKDKIR